MPITIETQGNIVVMQIVGVFNYLLHNDFMRSIREAQKNATYVVNLMHTEHIDSAGLGMLLMMREMVGGDAARISLVNPNQKVRGILFMSQFQELFQIT
ncbi:MAG: STAS domain-containing protein [Magnetococcus sp. DMHC-1]